MRKVANKKVKNAQTCSYGNLKFKSLLEKRVYTFFSSQGLNPQYESKTYTLWKSTISKVPFYDKETETEWKKHGGKRRLSRKSPKLLAITYTPDFYFNYRGLDIFIETKGFETNTFSIKKKLFRKYLSEQKQCSLFFEVYTLEQAKQVLDILKSLTMNTIKDIEKSLGILPEKDRKIALHYLNKRDFASLQELIESCIIIKEHDMFDSHEKPRKEWRDVDLMDLMELQVNIQTYNV